MMHEDGSYFLFYSASNYQLPSYRMMVARSGDLLGPYTKGEVPVVETDWDRCVAAPIVARTQPGSLLMCRYDHDQNSTFAGPGHGSVVRDTQGDWWLVYHGWR